ncbi:MAG: hypothetical protein JST64_00870 [Actinobacteria bacterium]|nr:hypothetical protein [Actinomycetota bacterium]
MTTPTPFIPKPGELFDDEEAAALTVEMFAELTYRRLIALQADYPAIYEALEAGKANPGVDDSDETDQGDDK